MITIPQKTFDKNAEHIENLCDRHCGRFIFSHNDQDETVHILFKNEMNEDCFGADLESILTGEVK